MHPQSGFYALEFADGEHEDIKDQLGTVAALGGVAADHAIERNMAEALLAQGARDGGGGVFAGLLHFPAAFAMVPAL